MHQTLAFLFGSIGRIWIKEQVEAHPKSAVGGFESCPRRAGSHVYWYVYYGVHRAYHNKTGTYKFIVRALFIFRCRVDNVARIKTQGKRGLGFGKATICIDFRPVEFEENISKTVKGNQ